MVYSQKCSMKEQEVTVTSCREISTGCWKKKNQTEDGQCGNRLPGESGYFHPQRFSKCDWKWVCATCSDIEFEQRLDKTTSEMLLQHKLCYSYSTIMHLSILLNLSKPKNKYSLKVSYVFHFYHEV